MKKIGGLVAAKILSSFSGTPIKSVAPSAKNNSSNTPTRDATMILDNSDVPLEYPFKLSLYSQAPQFDISIDDFEECAYGRMALLKSIDAATIRGAKEDEIRALVKQVEQVLKLTMHNNNVARSYPLEWERRRDLASHFILQLVFAGTVDGRRWLVQQETALLKARFHLEVIQEREAWLESELMGYEMLSGAKKQSMRGLLRDSSPHLDDILSEDFYLMPFHHVPDLVSRRTVYIQDGIAYVPKVDAFSAILTRFRKQLEEYLLRTAELLPQLKDNRITALVEAIKNAEYDDTTGTKEENNNLLVASEIEKLVAHFPPCMQVLHARLRADNHLKHGGRQQYGIFLKAINLPLEEALVFWKRAFSPKTPDDAFLKNYAYNIRHHYGQEGKRVPAPPQTCLKVIGSMVGAEDAHGCPFKHFKEAQLERYLRDYTAINSGHLTNEETHSIMELASARHYQLACTKLFQLTRSNAEGVDTVTHPHVFFEASMRSVDPNDMF